jgi:multidrug efflux system membrane fusion protein
LKRPGLKRIAFLIVALAVVGIGGYWAWRSYFAEPRAPAARNARRDGGAPVPVTAVPAARKDIPVALDALGTVQALASVTIRAQVDGVLVEVLFKEGQTVQAGQTLARIDPRPYQAALDQAVAKRAQDEAMLENARLDVQRYQQLSTVAGASRQQLDTARASVAQLTAQTQADDAAIANARTQLSFTTLTAPVNGVVGLRLVDQGNLVRASDATGIVTVAQMRPITVAFTLPQQQLPQVQAAMAAGPVTVQATAQGGDAPASGVLLALDNSIDAQTGTIRLKAQFANEDGRLWPGAFVTVRLTLRVLHDVVTVPLVAIQRGPDGTSVFVIGADGTVQPRPVTVGTMTADLAEIRSGLEPTDRVVTSGALKLTPGARVTEQAASGAPKTDPVKAKPGGPRPAAKADGKP